MRTMYPAAVNSPETVTMGAIAADTTTVTVQDISKIPDPPNLLVLGGERPDAETVLVTAVSANTITIQRGVQGTARAWEDRTTIARNFTAYDYEALRFNLLELDAAKASKPDQFTSGNFAILDAGGNPTDSGKNPDDFAPVSLTDTVAGQGQELQTLSLQAQQQAAEITGKADKVSGAIAGHIATLDADGNLVDGGVPIGDAGGTAIYISKTLSTSSWTKTSGNIWSQTVSDTNIKSGMRIDLAATPVVQQMIYSDGFSLTAYSDTDGIATVLACGSTKPSISMAILLILQKASGSLNRYGNSLGVPPIKYANKVEVVYLSPTGNDDTGDGSLSKPYKTISKIRDIVNGLRPNYEYIRFELCGGTYDVGGNLEFYLPANCGLYIQPYNSETVIINNVSLRFYNGAAYVSSMEIKSWSEAIRSENGFLEVGYCKISPYSSNTTFAIGVAHSKARIVGTQFNNYNAACVNCWETSVMQCINNTGSGNSLAHRCQGGIIIRTGTYPAASTTDQKIDGGQIFIG